MKDWSCEFIGRSVQQYSAGVTTGDPGLVPGLLCQHKD